MEKSNLNLRFALKITLENYLDLIKLGLPRYLVDYLDLIKSFKEIEGLIYLLTTKSVLISNGFLKQITFQDFPLTETPFTFTPIDGKF